MTPPLGLEINFCPSVTLTFDLLTLKVDRFMSLRRGLRCQSPSESIHSFSDRRVHKLGNGRTGREHLDLLLPVWTGRGVKSLMYQLTL